MLIWINGAFGVGKTQTAHELLRRVGSGHVADPELLGFALHKMLPPAQRRDFQDLPQWRSAVVATLEQLESHPNGPTIVPMSIVRGEYFEQIITGLRSRDVDVRHFTLTATPETLRRRLRTRLAYLANTVRGHGDTWGLQQVDRCVAALADDHYARHLPTDHASVDQIVETIAHDTGLHLIKPRLSAPGYQLRRLAIGVRHIRL